MKQHLIILFVLLSFIGTSQQNEPGLHGGNVQTSRDYKIEMVACSDYFEIYVYDLFNQPVLNSKITGNVIYHFKDKPNQREDLNHWGLESFTAKGADNFVTCSVNLFFNGRPVSVTFDNAFVCADK